jgi:hypothetical protein
MTSFFGERLGLDASKVKKAVRRLTACRQLI